MKYGVLGVLLVLFGFSVGAQAQQYQCSFGFTSTNAFCGTQSCSNSVTLIVPQGGGYGYGLQGQANDVDCCGFTMKSYTFAGYCSIAEFHDPKVQAHLIALAKSGDLLVANCDRNYVPYRPVPVELNTKSIDRDQLN